MFTNICTSKPEDATLSVVLLLLLPLLPPPPLLLLLRVERVERTQAQLSVTEVIPNSLS